MSFFKAGDTISGQEATAKMTVSNSNGTTTVEELFYGKSVEAKCEINKTEVKTLGKRGVQSKPTGWKGTGTLAVYYVTSLFRKMAIQYISTGIPVYFNLLVTNDDPGSSVGPQSTLLKNCTFDAVTLAKFDVDTEVLDESMDFTFDDAELMESFSAPTLGT